VTLRIGFDVPFEPFAFMENGEPRGMMIELLAAIFKHAALSFEWLPMSLAETEPALASGRVDALGFKGITAERHATMDFSAPLAISGGALFRRPDLRVSDDPHDFPGHTIVTPGKGPLAAKLARDYPELKLLLVDSYADAFEALLKGDAQLAALNFHAAIAMVKARHPGRIGLPAAPYAPLPIALAVAKGRQPGLVAAVDRALKALAADGTLAANSKRWLET